jgi:alkylation response protein AidB-like acyl-CoA dehydrogenase
MTTATITPTTLTDLVAQVEPVLREYAAQAEAARRLAPEAMTALVDAGLMRIWIPRVYGGLELDVLPALELFEQIARIDSAAGWLVANQNGLSTLGAMLPEETTAEMFADPRAICAGGLFPPAAAEPVQGGYRVSGQWSFGSGANYATWFIGQAIVHDHGAPRLGPDGNPVALVIFFPASEATVLDTWRTLGMRGTGSHDYRIDDGLVPDRRTWTIGPVESFNPAYASPLPRLGLWLVPAVNASVALGVAQAAIDDVITLAATKVPSYTQTGLADKPVVQERVARAQAYVDAGRRAIQGSVTDALAFVQSGANAGMAQGIPMALAGSFAVEAAVTAVDLIHASVGTTGIRDEQRFQQYFRDIHTLSQHAFSSASRFESLGKLLLGRETDWVFYYL